MRKCFKCDKHAVWCYMPSQQNDGDYYCDDCIPRGCSCNIINSTVEKEIYEYYKDELGRDRKPAIEIWYQSGLEDVQTVKFQVRVFGQLNPFLRISPLHYRILFEM